MKIITSLASFALILLSLQGSEAQFFNAIRNLFGGGGGGGGGGGFNLFGGGGRFQDDGNYRSGVTEFLLLCPDFLRAENFGARWCRGAPVHRQKTWWRSRVSLETAALLRESCFLYHSDCVLRNAQFTPKLRISNSKRALSNVLLGGCSLIW